MVILLPSEASMTDYSELLERLEAEADNADRYGYHGRAEFILECVTTIRTLLAERDALNMELLEKAEKEQDDADQMYWERGRQAGWNEAIEAGAKVAMNSAEQCEEALEGGCAIECRDIADAIRTLAKP